MISYKTVFKWYQFLFANTIENHKWVLSLESECVYMWEVKGWTPSSEGKQKE